MYFKYFTVKAKTVSRKHVQKDSKVRKMRKNNKSGKNGGFQKKVRKFDINIFSIRQLIITEN